MQDEPELGAAVRPRAGSLPAPAPRRSARAEILGKPLPRAVSAITTDGRWFCTFSPREIEMLLEELEGARQAELKSEAIVAR